MNKPKIAICWFGGCGGCDEAIVDLNEDLLNVANSFDIVLWPVALDFKYQNLDELNDEEMILSLINGCVRNSEHQELAHLLRKNRVISSLLVLVPALVEHPAWPICSAGKRFSNGYTNNPPLWSIPREMFLNL